MGDESLDVAGADNLFRWDRLTPTFQSGIHQAATLSFTPLTVADGGNYTCTNTITSPYLSSNRTATQIATVLVYGKQDLAFLMDTGGGGLESEPIHQMQT